jgi:hypothetical protein
MEKPPAQDSKKQALTPRTTHTFSSYSVSKGSADNKSKSASSTINITNMAVGPYSIGAFNSGTIVFK